MKTESTLHLNKHARGTKGDGERRTVVLGFLLEEGDTLEATDLYDSTSGYWEPAPCAGLVIGAGSATVWVRPDKS